MDVRDTTAGHPTNKRLLTLLPHLTVALHFLGAAAIVEAQSPVTVPHDVALPAIAQYSTDASQAPVVSKETFTANNLQAQWLFAAERATTRAESAGAFKVAVAAVLSVHPTFLQEPSTVPPAPAPAPAPTPVVKKKSPLKWILLAGAGGGAAAAFMMGKGQGGGAAGQPFVSPGTSGTPTVTVGSPTIGGPQ